MPKVDKKTKGTREKGYERPEKKSEDKDKDKAEEEEKEKEEADESEVEEEEEEGKRTRREGWLYVWRLNWVVSRFEGVQLCILAVGKAGGTKTTIKDEWADLMERLYHERYGYEKLNKAAKVAPPAIPGQQQKEKEKNSNAAKSKKTSKVRVERVTLKYVHDNLDYSFGDLALLLPREPHSKTGLDRGERVLRTLLGLSFPDDVVYAMAKELEVDITKIAGKLKATELVIAPLSTFESLRRLFRESYASSAPELRLSDITSLMAKAGPYTLHPDVVVEVRPGPKCDPAILTNVAILLPTKPSPSTTMTTTTTTTHSAGVGSASSGVVKIEETATYVVEENGVVVISE